MVRRLVSGAIYGLSAAIGLLAFAYPFLVSSQAGGVRRLTPVLTVGLVGFSLAALLADLQGEAMSAKTAAMLGVLVATASLLRFAEVAIPLLGGFSPVFVPIILAGIAFGSRFGFLMGVFTLLTSAIVTGGVGPWLPYQMFVAGWIGLTSGWLGDLRPSARTRPRPLDMVLMGGLGFVWGLLYGAVMNLYFWPYAAGWQGGSGVRETLARYAAFYLLTSLGWDLVRAVGNLVLILAVGGPVVQALARFRRRFSFEFKGLKDADGRR